MVRHPSKSRPKSQSAAEPIEVILLNPDGSPLATFAERQAEQEPRPDIGTTLAAGIRQLSQTTAAPGHRAGGDSDRGTRQGCDEEVVTPVLVSPDLAASAMADRRFFRQTPTGLEVDADSLQVDRGGLCWQATLRTGHLCTRTAKLRLSSSPSRNITVLELIPEDRRLIRTKSFVRRGVPAIGELASRLSLLSSPSN